MGTQSSKGKKHEDVAKYGQVYVQTDKSVYLAGETVTGRVYINLEMTFPGSQLYLKFKGKEVVSLVVSEKNSDDSYREEMYTEKKDIIKSVTPVYTWDSLLPGQYQIPFAFMVPPDLPASFHQEGYRYSAYVGYNLEAFLKPTNAQMSKLKYKQPLIIRETVKSAIQGYSNEVTVPLKCYCCCPKGSNTLRANFEKNFYIPGEEAKVIFKLDNSNSSLDNQKKVFALRQSLQLKARSSTSNQELIKVHQELPGIPAGKPCVDTSVSILLPQAKKDNYNHKHKQAEKSYLLKLKEDTSVLSSSTKSSLITSEYYLEVFCPMDGCCSNHPSIKCPIQLYQPEFQFAAVSPPMNWAPQEIPNVNVAFAPSQMDYAPQQGGNMAMMQGNMMQNQYPPTQQLGVMQGNIMQNQYPPTQQLGMMQGNMMQNQYPPMQQQQQQQNNIQYGQNFYGTEFAKQDNAPQGQPMQGQYGANTFDNRM